MSIIQVVTSKPVLDQGFMFLIYIIYIVICLGSDSLLSVGWLLIGVYCCNLC